MPGSNIDRKSNNGSCNLDSVSSNPNSANGMPNHIFRKLFIHDIRIGFGYNKWKYVLVCMTYFILCLMLYSSCSTANIQASFMDYLIFMDIGMPVYVPSPLDPFQIPILWMIPQILLALLVASYPTDDLHHYAVHVIYRGRNKKSWWTAKCSWVILTAVSLHLIGMAGAFLFSVFSGDLSLTPNYEVATDVIEMDIQHIPLTGLYLALCVPIFSSIALALVQTLLAFVIKPVISFVIMMAYMIASVYFFTPILIGDYSMLIRNGLITQDGLSSQVMIVVCLFVSVVTIIAGSIYFNKKDLLGAE